ncbi:MAG: PHB depolymerase family esterase [Polyangiaceae bacterium]
MASENYRSRCGALFALLLAGCSSVSTSAVATGAADAGSDTAPPPEPSPLIVARPYDLVVPTGYDAAKPTPLVIALHGYGDGNDGPQLETYFDLTPLANAKTFLYVYPNAVLDSAKERAWNGTDFCCDFYHKGTDDVGYIRALIDDVAVHYNLDPKRVFVTGISGGGVMAHRLACDLSDKIAAVVSLSGATWNDPAKCKPTDAVAVVEVHGDDDQVILYTGDADGMQDPSAAAPYPSAHDTVGHWATYDGCPGTLQPTSVTLDLEVKITGAETRVDRYEGCAKGAVELWTVQKGPHAPHLNTDTWGTAIYDFFMAHPKP